MADSIVQSGRETLEKAIQIINSTKKWGAKVSYAGAHFLFYFSHHLYRLFTVTPTVSLCKLMGTRSFMHIPVTNSQLLSSQLPGKTKDQAFRIGYDMADSITALNPPPVKLKFEKAGRALYLGPPRLKLIIQIGLPAMCAHGKEEICWLQI